MGLVTVEKDIGNAGQSGGASTEDHGIRYLVSLVRVSQWE